jgi:prefoldin subunit 5
MPPEDDADAWLGDLARIVADETRKAMTPFRKRFSILQKKTSDHDAGLIRLEELLGKSVAGLQQVHQSLTALEKTINATNERVAKLEGIFSSWDRLIQNIEQRQEDHSREMQTLTSAIDDLQTFDHSHDEEMRLMQRIIYGFGEGDDTRVIGLVGRMTYIERTSSEAVSRIDRFIEIETERKAQARQQRETALKIALTVFENSTVRWAIAIGGGALIGLEGSNIIQQLLGG